VNARLIPVLLAGLAMFGPATSSAVAAPVSHGHPLLGTWTFVVADGSCEETYRFRSDGSTVVTSGEEVAESNYEISAKPSADGYYKWVDTIVKDNGKKDCGGEITAPGRAITSFVRFNPSGEMLIICRAESLDACFGPLVRVHGDSI
jgi:hypothetical protein